MRKVLLLYKRMALQEPSYLGQYDSAGISQAQELSNSDGHTDRFFLVCLGLCVEKVIVQSESVDYYFWIL